jgi:hypothetical protein|tara:strand:- start:328 stop:846 length:519 start_codon:yes stop_codon:yes gene_type:complete
LDTKAIVKEYFSKHWVSRLTTYKYSNHSIANKIAAHERVIDVGCGNNEFIGKITNLTGIDIVNKNAHIITDIESYEPNELFNVSLCLGSIQYGTHADMVRQITKVVSLLTPNCRIYWRTNTGVRDHDNEMVNIVPYYPWTIAAHNELAAQFGFKIDFIDEDRYGRLYAEWSK